MRTHVLIAALGLAVATGTAHAGGFNIYEMGARATGLGGAFIGLADDPSAIFYNPAGLAFQEPGWVVSGNLALISPNTNFTQAQGATRVAYPGDDTARTQAKVFTPFGLYAAYRKPTSLWSFGLGVFTPFALGVDWDRKDTFSGRPISVNSNIRGFYTSPVVTVQALPTLSLSVGANIVLTELDLERIQTVPGTDLSGVNVTQVDLSGTSDVGFSAAAGLMWKTNDWLTIGVNYKGGVKNTFKDGDAVFTQIPTGIPTFDQQVAQQIADNGGNQKVSTSLWFPTILGGGAAFELGRVTLVADFVWFSWSQFDTVELEFENPDLNTTLEEDYQDGQQYRVGLDYDFPHEFRGTLGFAYDNTPQPLGSMSPTLPDANRLDYSAGLTWEQGGWGITVSYMFVNFLERSTVEDGVGQNYEGFDGTYDSVAHIPGLGVTYRF